MQELTLTGATVLDRTSKLTTAVQHSHHSHEHSHDRHRGCQSPTNAQLDVPVADLVRQSASQILQALQNIVRLGSFELFQQIATEWKEPDWLVPDAEGHFLWHWAAKRTDDIRFLKYFIDLPEICLLESPSRDETGMTAMHWTCTEDNALPLLKLLLDAEPSLLESKDTSGCTPLLIAAQYGQVESVAYLLKKGANLQAVDSNLDSATHWAAYKGSASVLGLLSYYDTHSFLTPDAYGQTPIHLASFVLDLQ